jgi:hypothetical protein
MTRLEAHGRFALMPDKRFLRCREFWDDPHLPAIATALAECAGWLDDATTDDKLREAAEQGETLYAIGTVSGDEIADAAHEIIMEVLEWAEAQGAEPCTDS